MITPDHFADLEAKAQAASPRPWFAERDLAYARKPRITSSDGHLVAEVGNCEVERQDQWEADAAYIVAACNAVPDLIGALRASEAREKELVEALKPFAIEGGGFVRGDDAEQWGNELAETTIGDFRRAARLLADRETGNTPAPSVPAREV